MVKKADFTKDTSSLIQSIVFVLANRKEKIDLETFLKIVRELDVFPYFGSRNDFKTVFKTFIGEDPVIDEQLTQKSLNWFDSWKFSKILVLAADYLVKGVDSEVKIIDFFERIAESRGISKVASSSVTVRF